MFVVPQIADVGFLLFCLLGKTSFVMALAGELDLNICVLSLSERGLTDDKLNMLFQTLPAKSILLLEDIDAVFSSREANSERVTVTFSGLLNALDGVVTSSERIVFMTTNHIERLDPALIRPGRVDVKEYVGLASEYQIKQMFETFYPEHTHLSAQFHSALRDIPISPATLQSHFIIHLDDPQGAVDNIQQMIKEQQEHTKRQQERQKQRQTITIPNI